MTSSASVLVSCRLHFHFNSFDIDITVVSLSSSTNSLSLEYSIKMMCHQQLLSIVSLFISLLAFLSGGGHIVHGFTTPVRGTVTVVGTSPIPHRTAKSLDTNNYRTPLLKALHLLPPRVITPSSVSIPTTTTGLQAEPTSDGDNSNNDANELIARRIIVVGDVDGGYYRSCVKNEVCFVSILDIFVHLFIFVRNIISTIKTILIVHYMECPSAICAKRLRDFVSSLGQ